LHPTLKWRDGADSMIDERGLDHLCYSVTFVLLFLLLLLVYEVIPARWPLLFCFVTNSKKYWMEFIVILPINRRKREQFILPACCCIDLLRSANDKTVRWQFIIPTKESADCSSGGLHLRLTGQCLLGLSFCTRLGCLRLQLHWCVYCSSFVLAVLFVQSEISCISVVDFRVEVTRDATPRMQSD
jgi:hypothetical protein